MASNSVTAGIAIATLLLGGFAGYTLGSNGSADTMAAVATPGAVASMMASTGNPTACAHEATCPIDWTKLQVGVRHTINLSEGRFTFPIVNWRDGDVEDKFYQFYLYCYPAHCLWNQDSNPIRPEGKSVVMRCDPEGGRCNDLLMLVTENPTVFEIEKARD